MSRVNQRATSKLRIGVLMIASIAVGGMLSESTRAQEAPPVAVEEAAAAVAEVPPLIEARLKEVQALRARAVKQGAAVKASCIDQKLRQIREARSAARTVVGGWPLAARNAEFRDRTIYRLRVLKLYAIASADAAYACVDLPAGTTVMTVEFTDPRLPLPPGVEQVRPATVDRPPLASPY